MRAFFLPFSTPAGVRSLLLLPKRPLKLPCRQLLRRPRPPRRQRRSDTNCRRGEADGDVQHDRRLAGIDDGAAHRGGVRHGGQRAPAGSAHGHPPDIHPIRHLTGARASAGVEHEAPSVTKSRAGRSPCGMIALAARGFHSHKAVTRGSSSVGRVPAFQAGRRGFESRLPLQAGNIPASCLTSPPQKAGGQPSRVLACSLPSKCRCNSLLIGRNGSRICFVAAPNS